MSLACGVQADFSWSFGTSVPLCSQALGIDFGDGNSGSVFKPQKQPVDISWGYYFYLQKKVDKLFLKVVRDFRDRGWI